MTTTTAVKSAAGKGVLTSAPEPVKLRKRIGSTTFIISVATNPSVTETAEKMLLRVIEGEVRKLA
ncbi:hypothetical protein FACS189425_02260 [Clostridia bacterium]|nr:hypothetical protein FACS189425_02260 [Clostridia bacterium]